MTLQNIATTRLRNQQINGYRFSSPKELVKYMGAIQAQDYPMSEWAVGLRVKGSTRAMVQDAVNSGEILRTHVLRPTWHLVTPEDLPWMLALTSERIKGSCRSRWRELALDERTFKQSQYIMGAALAGNNHLTREEIGIQLSGSLPLYDQRLAHLLLRAELDGVLCSGRMKNGKSTYALFTERVAADSGTDKDESLCKLAFRYFASHGPATLPDFVWWAGLSMTQARRGVELAKGQLCCEVIGGQGYWFPDDFERLDEKKSERRAVFLVPAYDELIISYKDRSAILPFAEQKKAISNNGLFRPMIVVDGIVTGTWKRTLHKDKVFIEPMFFSEPDLTVRELVREAGREYGRFLGSVSQMI